MKHEKVKNHFISTTIYGAATPNKQKSGYILSILDLVMVNVDGSPSQSMKNILDLARHAEQWNYKRYGLTEHHNIKGIASTGYIGINWLYSCWYLYY